jgi:hypothetical protein
MNEALVFDWIPFYEELADKLVAYRTRQPELIDYLENLRAQGCKITPLRDENEVGRRFLLKEIDPFTFFGTFNRGTTDDMRIRILGAIKKRFSVSAPIPSSFVGVPVLNPVNSRFFSFQSRRKPGDIGRLWEVFTKALGGDAMADPAFAEAFDRALEVAYTKVNLTMGLFWIRPRRYLSLDSKMRDYLDAQLPKGGLNFLFYKNTLERVYRESKDDIPHLSYLAYIAPSKRSEAADASRVDSYALKSELSLQVDLMAEAEVVKEEDLGAPLPTRRVVNISFNGQEGFVKSDQPLHRDTEYHLRIWVGGYHPESIVRNPATFPDEWLKEVMAKDGVMLRVVISSRDFTLFDEEQTMKLPHAGSSEVLTFRVKSPAATGTARLRAVLYYECNALQSLLVTAHITDSIVTPLQSALAAEVEYCLSGTLHNVEMYPARNLNFLTNESADGTHIFSVVGTDIRENFTFTEGEMKTSLSQARRALLETCAQLDKNGTPVTYRYDPTTNAGTDKQFVEDVTKLAWAGSDLYCEFVTNKNQSFAQKLRSALSKRAYIQVSSVKSAKYVFPWALVYDKPLVADSKNSVCGNFLQDLRYVTDLSDPIRVVAALETSLCLSVGCPARYDPNVICPSGFWGLKHILEQPPSVLHEPGTVPSDVQTHLIINGEAKMVMAISRKLDYSTKHYTEVSTLKRYKVKLEQNKSEVLSALKASPSPDLIYFYCHGGKEKGKGFLSVGDNEHLWVNDLVGEELSWPSSHPLVFINGCRTAELLPDDLLDFVNTFTWCQASGVIGTEISIPESLAQEFAIGIFKSLASPTVSLGESISAQRLLLLAKYNLLGLAYTPYCHSALQFEFRD